MREILERRQELCGGKLVVKGTRVPVRTLLASLAEGATEVELLADFPTMTGEGLSLGLLSPLPLRALAMICRSHLCPPPIA